MAMNLPRINTQQRAVCLVTERRILCLARSQTRQLFPSVQIIWLQLDRFLIMLDRFAVSSLRERK